MSRKSVTVAATIAAAALAGALGGAGAYVVLGDGDTVVSETSPTTADSIATTTETTTVGEIYAKTSRSVVEITVTSNGSSSPFDPQGGTTQAEGSGFVFDEQGHIVTNEHVVDGATAISGLASANGIKDRSRRSSARDPSTDLAVTPDRACRRTHFSRSRSRTRATSPVGDGVVAIGSPFGLEGT